MKEFAKWFNDEAMQVENYTDQVAVQAMLFGLQLESFKWDINRNLPKILSKTQKHIIAEELVSTRKSRPVRLEEKSRAIEHSPCNPK